SSSCLVFPRAASTAAASPATPASTTRARWTPRLRQPPGQPRCRSASLRSRPPPPAPCSSVASPSTPRTLRSSSPLPPARPNAGTSPANAASTTTPFRAQREAAARRRGPSQPPATPPAGWPPSGPPPSHHSARPEALEGSPCPPASSRRRLFPFALLASPTDHSHLVPRTSYPSNQYNPLQTTLHKLPNML